MTINIDDKNKYNNNVKIDYNYNDIPIYINQFKNTIQNDGFIKIPYISNRTDPDVIINKKQKLFKINNVSKMKQYKTLMLYIIKSQNIINDISYNAELIVEHKSTTNDMTLFTCFLLKFDNGINMTNIDELFLDASNNGQNDITKKEFSLNNLVNENKKNNKKTIFFEPDEKTSVVILTNPFLIKTSFDKRFVSLIPPLFTTSPSDYKILEPEQNSEGFKNPLIEGFKNPLIEGLTQSVYCQPVEMTDPSGEILSEASLSIPLEGKYSPNRATNDIIRTAINFMAFVIILGFTYTMSPIVYNDFIIGLIETQGQQKMIRVRSIDIYISIIFILISFGLVSQGITNNSPNYTIMGFFIGLFFIIAFVIIQSKKMTGSWFEDTFKLDNSTNIKSYYSNISVQVTIEDFMKFIASNFMFFLGKIYLGAMIFFTFAGILYLMGTYNKNGIMSTGHGIIYLVLFTIYMTILVSSVNK